MPEPQQDKIRTAFMTYNHSSRQCQILNPLSGPGIEPATSWVLVGFINHCATTGTPRVWYWRHWLYPHLLTYLLFQATLASQIWDHIYRLSCQSPKFSPFSFPLGASQNSHWTSHPLQGWHLIKFVHTKEKWLRVNVICLFLSASILYKENIPRYFWPEHSFRWGWNVTSVWTMASFR